MGYPGRKKNLANDMTGGRARLPIFIDFMKFFLKDKPKENFDKAPAMPKIEGTAKAASTRMMEDARRDVFSARRFKSSKRR